MQRLFLYGDLRSSGNTSVGALSLAVVCTLALACDSQPRGRSSDTMLRGDGPRDRLLDLGSSDRWSDGRSNPTDDASAPITIKPTNILNNGGFEYGLQCYGNWVWSNTGYIVPKAYYAIAQGVTGILYFSWEEFKKDAAKLDAVKQAFGELASLKDVIFSQGPTGVSGPDGVSFIARQYQGQTHILAVNPTSQSIQGSFSVAGLAAGKQVTVLFESRTITTESGQFSGSFDGVSRHVYRIE